MSGRPGQGPGSTRRGFGLIGSPFGLGPG